MLQFFIYFSYYPLIWSTAILPFLGHVFTFWIASFAVQKPLNSMWSYLSILEVLFREFVYAYILEWFFCFPQVASMFRILNWDLWSILSLFVPNESYGFIFTILQVAIQFCHHHLLNRFFLCVLLTLSSELSGHNHVGLFTCLLLCSVDLHVHCVPGPHCFCPYGSVVYFEVKHCIIFSSILPAWDSSSVCVFFFSSGLFPLVLWRIALEFWWRMYWIFRLFLVIQSFSHYYLWESASVVGLFNVQDLLPFLYSVS